MADLNLDRLNFVMGMDTRGVAAGGKRLTTIFGSISTSSKIAIASLGAVGIAAVAMATVSAKAASKFEDSFNETYTNINPRRDLSMLLL